jgi:dTDP-4-dehydrorhamnose reductase
MKPRILLIGENGQVGNELLHLLPRVGEVLTFDRRQLDLANPEDIRRSIRELRPHLIVNAAAFTAVDQAEKEEALARAINEDAPALLAEEAKKIRASLIHYSTDYVFDGLKTSPYEETDTPHPVSVYGKTKLAGEQAIRDAGVPHLILRTAWIYSTRGRNFLLTILRLASEREELKVVNDQIGAPTWSREIASVTSEILTSIAARGDRAFSLDGIGGTYHMTARGVATWCDFAQAILDNASRTSPSPPWLVAATNGRPLLARHIVPITTAEYPTIARRPAYSVLSNSLLTKTFGIQLPDWHTSLDDIFRAGNGAGLAEEPVTEK